VIRGRLVEVEAYDGENDRASHAYRGLTKRNRWMFEPGGLAYVYLIYGMHHCINVVTGEAGKAAAVLLRAAEMEGAPASASGPGRLTSAFRIDRTLDGASFIDGPLWLEAGTPVADRDVRRTRRIGVDYAGVWAARRYRFIVKGHPSVSGPKALR
jgi:DNA-3-methyladenine glycosylase